MNDIEDAEYLDAILKRKYPKLKYKIIVVLVCEYCFDKKTYTSNNIFIYNISRPNVDNDLCEKLFIHIFKISHIV